MNTMTTGRKTMTSIIENILMIAIFYMMMKLKSLNVNVTKSAKKKSRTNAFVIKSKTDPQVLLHFPHVKNMVVISRNGLSLSPTRILIGLWFL